MSQEESSGLLYEIRSNKELGRYLVALRDIQPREIIIREDPLVTGPTDRGGGSKDVPVCLGCHYAMLDNPRNRCSGCHWPVCSEFCEKLPCHASNECQLFTKNRVLYPPPYGYPYISKSIVILRCFLLKSQNPGAWAQLMSMADNKEVRAGKPNCINTDKRILANFAKFMPSQEELERETETLRQISGIIDTNAHAFPLSINGRSTFVCNLYSKTSLMAHNCQPNCSWAPDKSFSSLTLTIRSNVAIAKGQPLNVAYDDGQLLVCTLKRLVPAELNGMFICRCERCLDPTELGTYIGALRCPSCNEGYLLPIDPVDSFSSWKCDNGQQGESGKEKANTYSSTSSGESGCGESGNCNLVLDDESVMEILEEAEQLCGYTKLNLGSPALHTHTGGGSQDEEESCLELLKEFAREYGGAVVHPNHYILQEVNVRILKGDYRKGLSNLETRQLTQYLERCEKLLGIANVLTPGFCEYRAFLQFHFVQGLLALERRKEENTERNRKRNNENEEEEGNDEKRELRDDGNEAAKLKQGERKKVKETGTEDDGCGGGDELNLKKNSKSNGSDDDNDDPLSSRKKNRRTSEHWGKYGNSRENLERLLEMLEFLLEFFLELNPEHRLLAPIKETLEETKSKLKTGS